MTEITNQKISFYIINVYSSLFINISIFYFLGIIFYRRSGFIGLVVTKYLSMAVLVPYILMIPVFYALKVDREHVSNRSDWNPGPGYFAMCIPHPLLMAISLVYIYRRHKNAPSTGSS